MYKVGEKVIAIKDTSYSKIGQVGVIESVDTNPNTVFSCAVVWEGLTYHLWVYNDSYKLKHNWLYRFFFTGIE